MRQFAYQAAGLSSCEIARVEFCSVIQRHLREGNINSQEAQDVLNDFEQDEGDGVWKWFPVSAALIQSACKSIDGLPSTTFLRALDAIHLACARENGFSEIYTNDRRMLDCARYFSLKGINLIP